MHPILFQIGDDFFIGTYGLMIAIGLLAGTALAAWRGRYRGYRSEVWFDLTFVAVVSGFLGARVLYILLDIPGFLEDPMAYLLSRSGFVFLGGFVAAAGALIWYMRLKGLDPWKTADVLAPSVALGHAFGRIGCHLSGCCYGGACSLPVALRVPRVEMGDGAVWENAYAAQLREGLIDPAATQSLGIWPVQLMESASLFVLCGVLVLLATRPLHKGMIFAGYLGGYSVLRFLLEFIRGDERGGFAGFSTSQWLSAVLLLVAVGIVVYARRLDVYGPDKEPMRPEPEPDSGSRQRKRRRASS